jgi:hypothetical protein
MATALTQPPQPLDQTCQSLQTKSWKYVSPNNALAALSDKVSGLKKSNLQTEGSNGYNKFLTSTLVGVDVFTFATLGIDAVKAAIPALGANHILQQVLYGCGILSGLTMCTCGVLDFKAGFEKFHNGNKGFYGTYLMLTGVAEILLGVFLTVPSFEPTLLNKLPWLLSVLFFASSVFTMIEIGKKWKLRYSHQALNQKMELEVLLGNLRKLAQPEEYIKRSKDPASEGAVPLLKADSSEQDPKDAVLASIAKFLSVVLGIEITKDKLTAEGILKEIEKQFDKGELEKQIGQIRMRKKKEGVGQKQVQLNPPDAHSILEEIKTKGAVTTLSKFEGVVEERAQDYDTFHATSCWGRMYKFIMRKNTEVRSQLTPIELLFMYLSSRQEELAEDMGVEGAIVAMELLNPMIQLLEALKNGKETTKLCESVGVGVEKLISKRDDFYWVLFLRTIVQLLNLAGCVYGFVTSLMPSANSLGSKGPNYKDVIQYGILSVASIFPTLIIDARYKWLRGTPAVVGTAVDSATASTYDEALKSAVPEQNDASACVLS